MGDPASIGPEIIARAIARSETTENARCLVIGEPRILRRALRITSARLSLHAIESPAAGHYESGVLNVLAVPMPDAGDVVWGQIQASAGRAAFECITRSIDLAMSGEIDAVVTAPINKEALRAAGVSQIGHTEIFGERTGTPDPLTMFEVKGLRIFFLTRHVSLADAVRLVTRKRVLDALLSSARALSRLGIESPRIAVAALNPHGGEHGLFGFEEDRELVPAIKEARSLGVSASGPHPADSVFWQAAHGRFDAVLSLYHDQGHIAAKMFDFEATVSITNGLPFLRTSVDHGTAFDIAGKGLASEVSMVEAIKAAAKYAGAFKEASATRSR